MNDFSKLALGITIVILLTSTFTGTVNAQGSERENYKNLLNTIDGAIRTFRLRGENSASMALKVAENQYGHFKSLYENTIRYDSRLSNLDNDINAKFDSLQQSPSVDGIRDLRGMVSEMANGLGVELSFLYKYAFIIILFVSLVLAFSVNMVSRTIVDWEKVNKVKRKSEELKNKLKKARREGKSKKVHKLMKEQQEFTKKHMGVLFSPMKTMLIIIIPFIIIFQLLSSTYGGWVVAWMPVNLPWPNLNIPLLSRFFPGTVASLSFFGWYLLSYFGFSMTLRRFLIPSK
ncbi:hypothetical protein AKJ48_02400 [candidate division MSBL1 archaeon SCGC-AAA261O19]|uniref:DUF106 domain-containing protein n=1 Tax=candidate division MSBL1 archaeon SCGC-AAA261O19 TaxID=1698277 RepID=A0A133VDF4_9EURY|nr:hypothetical protein AKJ48_02400 [candidate division MSBL1 archaeon SCGC-AAA261O19]